MRPIVILLLIIYLASCNYENPKKATKKTDNEVKKETVTKIITKKHTPVELIKYDTCLYVINNCVGRFHHQFIEVYSENDTINDTINQLIHNWIKEQLPHDLTFEGCVTYYDTISPCPEDSVYFDSYSELMLKYDTPKFLSLFFEGVGENNWPGGSNMGNWILCINLNRQTNSIIELDSIISIDNQLKLQEYLLHQEETNPDLEELIGFRGNENVFKLRFPSHDTYEGFTLTEQSIIFHFIKGMGNVHANAPVSVDRTTIAPFLNPKYKWIGDE